MRWLAIDRSSAHPGMAIFDGAELAFEHVWDGEPTRAPEWLAEVAQQLAEHSMAADQMERFVCGLGPGSFSGIRACLAALQGLALPGGRPVFGVASAAALALGVAGDGECMTVVGDARRNRLWSVTYRVDAKAGRVRLCDGRAPTHTEKDFLLTPASELAAAVPAGTRIVSSDWERLSGVLSASFAAGRLVPHAVFPRASDLGRLAVAEPEACVFEPVPVYLHPAVALAATH